MDATAANPRAKCPEDVHDFFDPEPAGGQGLARGVEKRRCIYGLLRIVREELFKDKSRILQKYLFEMRRIHGLCQGEGSVSDYVNAFLEQISLLKFLLKEGAQPVMQKVQELELLDVFIQGLNSPIREETEKTLKHTPLENWTFLLVMDTTYDEVAAHRQRLAYTTAQAQPPAPAASAQPPNQSAVHDGGNKRLRNDGDNTRHKRRRKSRTQRAWESLYQQCMQGQCHPPPPMCRDWLKYICNRSYCKFARPPRPAPKNAQNPPHGGSGGSAQGGDGFALVKDWHAGPAHTRDDFVCWHAPSLMRGPSAAGSDVGQIGARV